jgi:hypothetical protein
MSKMFVLVHEETNTVSIGGLDWDHLFVLEAALINLQFSVRPKKVNKPAAELMALSNIAMQEICEPAEVEAGDG